MDIMGPLACTASGKRYVLVATDLFTRWVEAVPLADQSALSVARAFIESVVLRHGNPQALLTDQGPNFESHLLKEICELLKVKKIRTSIFHPRTDGQAERVNRVVKERITALGVEWEETLPFVVHSINATVHSMTGFSPYRLVYGRDPPQFFERSSEFSSRRSIHEYINQLEKNLRKVAMSAKVNSDSSKELAADKYRLKHACGWVPFAVGSRVKYHNRYPNRNNRKFSDRYIGPFTVEARKGVVYKIMFKDGRYRWIHHDDLLPWRGDACDGSGQDPGEAVDQGQECRDIEERRDAGMLMESESSSGESDEENEVHEDDRGAVVEPSSSSVVTRRSARDRRPPGWLRDFYVH